MTNVTTTDLAPRFETIRVMSFDCPVCRSTVSVARKDAVGAVLNGGRIRIGCPECKNIHTIARPHITTLAEHQARQALGRVSPLYDGEIN